MASGRDLPPPPPTPSLRYTLNSSSGSRPMSSGCHCSCLRSASGSGPLSSSTHMASLGSRASLTCRHCTGLLTVYCSRLASGLLPGLPPTLPYPSLSCLSTSIVINTSLAFRPDTGHPAMPGLFGSVSLHVLCLQPHPSNALHPFFPASSSRFSQAAPMAHNPSLHLTPSAPC